MTGWACLVQRRGLGSWFQCAAQCSMTSLRSATEVNARFLRALRVRIENQRSTRFAQLELVGGEVQVPSLAFRVCELFAHRF